MNESFFLLVKRIAAGTILCIAFAFYAYLGVRNIINLITNFSLYSFLLNIFPIVAFAATLFYLYKFFVKKADGAKLARYVNSAVMFLILIIIANRLFEVLWNNLDSLDFTHDYLIPSIAYYVGLFCFIFATSRKKEFFSNIFGGLGSGISFISFLFITYRYFHFAIIDILYILVFLLAIGYNGLSLLIRFMFGSEE